MSFCGCPHDPAPQGRRFAGVSRCYWALDLDLKIRLDVPGVLDLRAAMIGVDFRDHGRFLVAMTTTEAP
jgi:hypothetical protein